MSVKKYETEAQEKITQALNLLREGRDALNKASASCDDFPTARAELSSLATQTATVIQETHHLLRTLDL